MILTRSRPIMLALAALASAAPADARPEDSRLADLPKLTVRGEAQLDRPADQLRIQIGVVTEASEAPVALDTNSRRMNDVVKAVRRVGLDEQEYETGRFSLSPVYSRRERSSGPDWRPQIVAYRVTNTLLVKTMKLELAGELIQAANEAGANTIDSIGFDLSDPRKHRAEAIAQATKNALADARVLAGAADLELVRILSVQLDAPPWQPVPLQMGRGVAVAAEAVPTTPVVPGDVTVRAAVTIVWEVGPAR